MGRHLPEGPRAQPGPHPCAASAALKLATVPRAKMAAKRYFMISPVFSRKGGAVPNLFAAAEWNMNAVIVIGATAEPLSTPNELV
jgi:hypothetical protein